ncbi:TonB-dependent receptor plug domain-containing protein [Pseudocnuella soli]|uniref:TonB-dependent receptor plug domain-containing protein n=1 Tax=Pseudocnuella soli TaxID=2502779 RepID=UPI001049CC1E|nr:TonB-dependent receptor [Pseudocnuella soli]
MKKGFFVVTAALISSWAQAQNDTTSLDQVIVTANRFPQKQSTTGKVVTVVTNEQLQRSGGKDLAQLLSEQTGITINSANANAGKDKSLFVQGASTAYTVILVDGVTVNDPSGSGGTFDIRLFPIEQIERIEILKGSQSTLYGSSAIAGVINIITKRGTTAKPSVAGLLSYGSYNTRRGQVGLSQKLKAIDYSINYERLKTDGISEAKDTTGKAGFDKDGFDRQSINAQLGINVTEGLRLAPFYRFTEFKGDYDAGSFADGNARYTGSLVNAGLIGKLDYSGGAVNFNYGHSYTKRNYNGSALAGNFHQAEAFVTQELSKQLQLLAGVNYQTMRMPKPDTTNNILSTYASLLLKTGIGFNAELGGRYNRHSQYGDNFTYSFNPSYLLHDRVKLFANLGTGFRAPGISELFGPFGANPNLKPEHSRSFEGGVQAWTPNRDLSVRANYFNRRVKDVIIYGRTGYQNRDQQHDQGVELELQYQPGSKWNFRANYTYLDGEITQKLQPGKDTSYFNLLRRPRHSLNLFAGYQLTEALFVSATVQHISGRDDVFYDASFRALPKKLKAYTLVHAYAEYLLAAKHLRIFADARNLTNNKDYIEVYGYNVQGFTFQGGLRFTL